MKSIKRGTLNDRWVGEDPSPFGSVLDMFTVSVVLKIGRLAERMKMVSRCCRRTSVARAYTLLSDVTPTWCLPRFVPTMTKQISRSSAIGYMTDCVDQFVD